MGPLIEPASGKLLHALTTLGAAEEWLVAAEAARRHRPALVARHPHRRAAGFVLPPHRVLRSGARHHDRAQPRRGHPLPERRSSTGSRPASTRSTPDELGALARHRRSGQPLREPRDHRRDRAAPAVRRLEAVLRRRRHQGGRPELPDRARHRGSPRPGSSSASLHLRGLEPRVSDLIESGQSSMDYTAFDLVRRSALSDAIAAANEYHRVEGRLRRSASSATCSATGPVPVAIRLSEGELASRAAARHGGGDGRALGVHGQHARRAAAGRRSRCSASARSRSSSRPTRTGSRACAARRDHRAPDPADRGRPGGARRRPRGNARRRRLHRTRSPPSGRVEVLPSCTSRRSRSPTTGSATRRRCPTASSERRVG